MGNRDRRNAIRSLRVLPGSGHATICAPISGTLMQARGEIPGRRSRRTRRYSCRARAGNESQRSGRLTFQAHRRAAPTSAAAEGATSESEEPPDPTASFVHARAMGPWRWLRRRPRRKSAALASLLRKNRQEGDPLVQTRHARKRATPATHPRVISPCAKRSARCPDARWRCRCPTREAAQTHQRFPRRESCHRSAADQARDRRA